MDSGLLDIRRYRVKPPIKDTPKEDKPPNKGQAKRTHVYTLYRKSPLKEDNLSTKDKTAGLACCENFQDPQFTNRTNFILSYSLVFLRVKNCILLVNFWALKISIACTLKHQA